MTLIWRVVGLLGFLLPVAASFLPGIPTVPFNVSVPAESYSVTKLEAIIVDSRYANTVDANGLTLIPPTLWSFAETFRSDHFWQP